MATAKTTKITSQAEWNDRALELAYQKHAIGTPRYVGKNDCGAQIWQVPSRTHDGCYLVMAWPNGKFTCGCVAGTYSQPCCHAGAVIRAEAMRTEESRHDTQLTSWLNGGDW